MLGGGRHSNVLQRPNKYVEPTFFPHLPAPLTDSSSPTSDGHRRAARQADQAALAVGIQGQLLRRVRHLEAQIAAVLAAGVPEQLADAVRRHRGPDHPGHQEHLRQVSFFLF